MKGYPLLGISFAKQCIAAAATVLQSGVEPHTVESQDIHLSIKNMTMAINSSDTKARKQTGYIIQSFWYNWALRHYRNKEHYQFW